MKRILSFIKQRFFTPAATASDAATIEDARMELDSLIDEQKSLQRQLMWHFAYSNWPAHSRCVRRLAEVDRRVEELFLIVDEPRTAGNDRQRN